MTGLGKAEAQELLDVAGELADVARKATLAHFRSRGLSAESKETDRFDPVTVADRDAEVAMRAVLARRRPQDGILGEELPDVDGISGLTWVLDPIDGTRGFLSGTPTWGVLIALSNEAGPIMGVIDQP
ncbi:histidinol-phosphatase, partial [Thioclava sp. BHET1]